MERVEEAREVETEGRRKEVGRLVRSEEAEEEAEETEARSRLAREN